MLNPIPSATEQLQFLKNIQLILQAGSFSSTYKFALLMCLSRLAIEKGQASGDSLTLQYHELAEKFVELYWKQTIPYHFSEDGQLILHQNNGKQAAIVKRLIDLRQQYKSLGALRRDDAVWSPLLKSVAKTIKEMPVRYLQNINGRNVEFLYQSAQSSQSLVLLPKVMYCLRQFSEIIEELCQKRWLDYIRHNSTNAPILNQLPNLEQFMFEPNRNQLNAVAKVLIELQDCRCFYCHKVIKNKEWAVDHFVPWSIYPSDTGHNFVLADTHCNTQKSNLLAADEFLHQWHERNETQDAILVSQLSELGFITDKTRSHKVAEWAYAQAAENGYVLWAG